MEFRPKSHVKLCVVTARFGMGRCGLSSRRVALHIFLLLSKVLGFGHFGYTRGKNKLFGLFMYFGIP